MNIKRSFAGGVHATRIAPSAPARRPHPPAGWTLIELMVVIVVMALLLGVGVPALNSVLREYHLASFTNDLRTAILLTRSEAALRGHRVTLCTSADGRHCSVGVRWDTGWIMFPDPNANAQTDPGEELLRVRTVSPSDVQAIGNSTIASYISYVPSGATRAVTGALQMGTIRICSGTQQRILVISASGRVRVARGPACD